MIHSYYHLSFMNTEVSGLVLPASSPCFLKRFFLKFTAPSSFKPAKWALVQRSISFQTLKATLPSQRVVNFCVEFRALHIRVLRLISIFWYQSVENRKYVLNLPKKMTNPTDSTSKLWTESGYGNPRRNQTRRGLKNLRNLRENSMFKTALNISRAYLL